MFQQGNNCEDYEKITMMVLMISYHVIIIMTGLVSTVNTTAHNGRVSFEVLATSEYYKSENP